MPHIDAVLAEMAATGALPKRHSPGRWTLACALKAHYHGGDISILDLSAAWGLSPTYTRTLLVEAGAVMRRGPMPDPSFDTIHADGTPMRVIPGVLGAHPLHLIEKS